MVSADFNTALFHAGRNTRQMGTSLLHYRELDSTNTQAKRLIRSAGAAHGSLLITENQSDGRGRGERRWQSLPGNLAITLILSSSAPLAQLVATPLVAGLALYDTLRSLAQSLPLRLKWPNDVLIDNQKCAGILVESEPDTETKDLTWVMVGLGINIAAYPTPLAHALTPPTSLSQHGLSLTRETLLAGFLNHFERLWSDFEYAGFSPLKARYLEASQLAGSMVRVHQGNDLVEGRVHVLTDMGALVITTADGAHTTLYSGDLV